MPRGARAWPAALAAGLVPLAVYAWALHPGLPAGDSGELITVAATGGIAHPPGYPLYTLLAGLWLRLVPFGTVAWRVNLFSAVCAAAAAAGLAIAVARTTGSRPAGVFAGWAWGLCLPVFRYALVAEVFALNALLASGVLLALVSPPAAGSVALAFLCALALSHHHTLLLLALPALGVTAWRAWRATSSRMALATRLVAATFAGLLPLAWLPFAGARHAGALSWGEPATLKGFLSLLTRAEYGTFRLDPAGAGFTADAGQLARFVQSLPHALGAIVLALAVVGAWRAARSQRWRGPALAIGLYGVAQAWFFTRIGFPTSVAVLRGVVERFYILPLAVLAFLAGLAAAWLMARAGRGRAVIASGLLALALLPLATGQLARASQRANLFTEALGHGLLASLPRDAVVFVRGDMLHNSLAYLTQVAHKRPDVAVIDEELMSYPWYVRQVRARWPGVLPALGRAERITLADGRTFEGLAIPRPDGSVDVLTESGQQKVSAAAVASVRLAPPESLYRGTRAAVRRAPFLEQGEDRYSGLPGTLSLLWFDHLAGRRPVAVIGVKDESWKLRYSLVSMGLVDRVVPRGVPTSGASQLEAALAVTDAVDPQVYFADYGAESLEASERGRFSGLVARTALLLCLPDAAPVVARHPLGYARVLAFARRFEPLAPSPDPDCLAAIGYLRWVDPSLRALPAARSDLERALSERPALADGARARRVLAALRDSLR